MADWGSGVNQVDTSQTGDGKESGLNKLKTDIANIYSKLNLLRLFRSSNSEPLDIIEKEFWYNESDTVLYRRAAGASKAAQLLFHDGKTLNVKLFGAKGDGVTDDTAAINAMVTYAQALSYKVVFHFPSAVGYAVASPVVLPVGYSVIMDAPIIYTGNQNVKALTIGAQGQNSDRVILKLWIKRSTVSDWTDEASIGICLFGVYRSYVDIVETNGFTIGAQLIGSGKGVSYNEIHLRYIVNNKIGVDCTNETYAAKVGWCNENIILGGNFTCQTGVNAGKSRYGIRITSKDGTYPNNNNNVFLKPSFEIQQSQANPGEAIPILMENGLNNRIEYIRNEGNNNITVRELNNSTENVYSTGYGNLVIDCQSTLPAYKITPIIRGFMDFPVTVFNSGHLPDKTAKYDANYYHVANMHFARTTDNVAYKARTIASVTNDYIEISSTPIGVFVDTAAAKRFIVKRNGSEGGRIAVVCYDVNGSVLDNSTVRLRGRSGNVLTYNASNYGGCYQTGSDGLNDVYFKVNDEVKKIRVLWADGSANAKLNNVSIHTLDYDCTPTVYPGYEQVIPGANIATQAPDAGTYQQGKIIYNAAPVAASAKGWRCTVAGTPGTWEAI